MADLSILAILSFFGWLSIDRRNFIGVLLCIALAIALGVSNG
ncbi:hypothetical protein [Pseudomonas nitroreducens]|nr:hypothetical protein [Pseudomonas nitroreducens]MCP1651668.1 hypothetical protein [Pseudomonas nitroreducens]MCP1684467.1 hypothetical protein [Pseudomonas nitroreducens]